MITLTVNDVVVHVNEINEFSEVLLGHQTGQITKSSIELLKFKVRHQPSPPVGDASRMACSLSNQCRFDGVRRL